MNNNIKLTAVELESVKSIKPGDSVYSESGYWSLHDSGKGFRYLLLINRNEDHTLEFSDLDSVLSYLNGKSVKSDKMRRFQFNSF